MLTLAARWAAKIRARNLDTSSATAAISTVGVAYMMFQPLLDARAEGDGSDYDQLPEPIKQVYSQAQYLWLSDAEKAALVDQECEPEW